MEAVFKFYTQQYEPLGIIRCQVNSTKFKRLLECGYSYSVPTQRRTGSDINTFNRLDTPGDFEKLQGMVEEESRGEGETTSRAT